MRAARFCWRILQPSAHTASPGDTSQSVLGEVQTVPQGFVELRVEDQGPGMDETTMHRALEPFFTTSPFGERAGLGLSMVHGVVSQNGGQVLLESREERGTCVRIRWPVHPGA